MVNSQKITGMIGCMSFRIAQRFDRDTIVSAIGKAVIWKNKIAVLCDGREIGFV